MIKLLSLVLSFTLIFTSVAPSVAQVVSDKQHKKIAGQITESLGDISAQVSLSFLKPVEATSENMSFLLSPYKANTQDSLYLAEITHLVNVLAETKDAKDNAQQAPQEPTLEEFEKMYREANTPALKQALSQTDDPIRQELLKLKWEEWIQTHVKQAYQAYLEEYHRLMAQSEQDFKNHIKELADKAVAGPFLNTHVSSIRRTDVNDPVVYKTIDPVSQFVPLMQSAFGESVVSKQTRSKAAQALQTRVHALKKLCSHENTKDCPRLLEETHMLAMIATTPDQLQTVADVLVDYAADPAVSPAFINTLGADLIAVNDLDKDYSKLYYALTTLVNKAEKMDTSEASVLSAVNWVDLARELSSQQRKFSRPLYNASFYNDPKDGFANNTSAWTDLGLLIGRVSQQNQTLRDTMNSWLESNQIVWLRGKGETRTRFNLFLTGLVAGGFAFDIKGTSIPTTEMYTDVNGQAKTRTVAATEPQIASFRAWLKEKGLTQSQWLAFYLYNMGGMELDPATVRYLRNYLAGSVKDKQKAAQLGLVVSKHPTVAEVEAYSSYQTALKVAGVVDIINRFIADTILIVVVFKGVGAAARFGATYARAVQLATAASRGGKAWVAISKAGRLAGISSRMTFGAKTPMQAFIKAARANRTYPNFFTDAAQLTKVVKNLKPVSAGMGGGYIVLDGTAHLVPQGFKYVQISVNGATRFVLVENTPQALAQLARTYGVEASAITDAVNGSVSAAQAAQVYTTTGAAGVHTGTTGVVQNLTGSTAGEAASSASAQTAAQGARQAAWMKAPATNALGQTVQSWEPVMLEMPAAAASSAAPRTLSFSDKLRMWWELQAKPLFKFGTSRYGAASLTSGAMPVTGEMAITGAQQWGQGIEVVERMRTAQRAILSADELYSGAGASYRLLAINRGGIAAQQYAQAAAGAGTGTTLTGTGTFGAAGLLRGAGYLSPSFTQTGNGLLRQAAFAPAQPSLAPATSSNSGILFSTLPLPYHLMKRFGTWMTGVATLNLGATDANKISQLILDKTNPLPSQLRDIVLSSAAETYKKKALLRLYNQGVFNNFLQQQPQIVQDTVINATSNANRSGALWNLYQAHYLDDTLAALTDVQAQGSILSELQKIVSQEDWAAQARSAYEVEAVLPLQNENFSGSVASVPEADLEKIENTIRPEGYAVQNSAQGIPTKKGVFYKNNVPFYYRNSKGQLSSEPVGILTQIPANWYGRFLSSIYLATQPGLVIPEGFVLALDEQGQWKFAIPKGNFSAVESNKTARKQLAKMNKEGSARVSLDMNYTTSDLLAIAHAAEHHPDWNFELQLNTPHSLNPFLVLYAFFVGNDAGNTLTGPFKESLKAFKGVSNMIANLVSGIGYATPIAGGYAMPTMQLWGSVKTTKVIYAASAAALAFSTFALGMYGTVDPATLPLVALAVPTVALVLGASLVNSFIPTFLNFYKDPTARTAANLQFDTRKQMSRLGLSGILSLAAMADLNWTLVAPIGLGLLAVSYALFLNTPMYRGEKERLAKKAEAEKAEKERLAALSPEERQKEKEQRAAQKKAAEELKAKFVEEYKEFRNNHAEMQASKGRVKKVYAAYAASLMLLGQNAVEAFGKDMGQMFITLCMAATLGTRLLATSLVKKNIMTDDQLTGLSLPTMAYTALALALLPYSGPLAVLTGVAAVAHYMSTAVPGRLDAARMQNIVTAEMQQRKQAVMDDDNLTDEEKKAKVDLLTQEEGVWSGQASKDYSFYNAFGLAGIITAGLAALAIPDLGTPEMKEFVEGLFSWTGVNSLSLSLNRLLFIYAAGVAGWAYWTNRDLTAEGLRFFRKKTAVTAENIAADKVTPKELGINDKNAQIQLGNITNKRMKEVENMLIEYGISSEQKMTKAIQQIQFIHNRLVAIGSILGASAVKQAFEREGNMVKKMITIFGQNDLSVMLRRELGKLQGALFVEGSQTITDSPSYVEEGLYNLPGNYASYETAGMLVRELDQMTYNLRSGNQIDYHKFVEYLTRTREYLVVYEKANPADSIRVVAMRRKLADLCKWLATADAENGLLDVLATDSPQIKAGKQALRDILAGYQESNAGGMAPMGAWDRMLLGDPIPAR